MARRRLGLFLPLPPLQEPLLPLLQPVGSAEYIQSTRIYTITKNIQSPSIYNHQEYIQSPTGVKKITNGRTKNLPEHKPNQKRKSKQKVRVFGSCCMWDLLILCSCTQPIEKRRRRRKNMKHLHTIQMYSGGMAEKETGFGVITIGDPAVHSWFRLREKLARQLSGLWWKIFWQCAKVSAAAGHTCRSLPKVERRAPAVEAFSFFCSVLRARQPLARSHYTRAPVLFTG